MALPDPRGLEASNLSSWSLSSYGAEPSRSSPKPTKGRGNNRRFRTVDTSNYYSEVIRRDIRKQHILYRPVAILESAKAFKVFIELCEIVCIINDKRMLRFQIVFIRNTTFQ